MHHNAVIGDFDDFTSTWGCFCLFVNQIHNKETSVTVILVKISRLHERVYNLLQYISSLKINQQPINRCQYLSISIYKQISNFSTTLALKISNNLSPCEIGFHEQLGQHQFSCNICILLKLEIFIQLWHFPVVCSYRYKESARAQASETIWFKVIIIFFFFFRVSKSLQTIVKKHYFSPLHEFYYSAWVKLSNKFPQCLHVFFFIW